MYIKLKELEISNFSDFNSDAEKQCMHNAVGKSNPSDKHVDIASVKYHVNLVIQHTKTVQQPSKVSTKENTNLCKLLVHFNQERLLKRGKHYQCCHTVTPSELQTLELVKIRLEFFGNFLGIFSPYLPYFSLPMSVLSHIQ